ncbi:hypothetical protein EPUL_006494, partial [Erysiphe pulchra]
MRQYQRFPAQENIQMSKFIPTQIDCNPPNPTPAIVKTVENTNSLEEPNQQQHYKLDQAFPENIQTHRQQTEDYYRPNEYPIPQYHNQPSDTIQYPKINQPQSSRFPRIQESQNHYNMPSSSQAKPFFEHATEGYSHRPPLSQTYNQIRQNKFSHGRELAVLLKIYKDDMLYSGGNDSLDLKLHIFYELCRKAGVSPTQEGWSEAFSTMLKGDARDFYYDNISGRGFSFETMVNMTRQHFETAERHQQLLSNWYSISLQSLKRENPDKSTAECFELMLNQLRKLQRGLGHEYRSQTTLRDRLINA